MSASNGINTRNICCSISTIFPFAVISPETVSDPSVPTLVSEELTTPIPVWSMLKHQFRNLIMLTRCKVPVLKICAEVALFQVIVFSIDSELIPSPAPSKRAFVPVVVAIPILKSSKVELYLHLHKFCSINIQVKF